MAHPQRAEQPAATEPASRDALYPFLPNAIDPADALNDGAAVLSFLDTTLCCRDDEVNLSREDQHGLSVILRAVRTAMESAARQIGTARTRIHDDGLSRDLDEVRDIMKDVYPRFDGPAGPEIGPDTPQGVAGN